MPPSVRARCEGRSSDDGLLSDRPVLAAEVFMRMRMILLENENYETLQIDTNATLSFLFRVLGRFSVRFSREGAVVIGAGSDLLARFRRCLFSFVRKHIHIPWIMTSSKQARGFIVDAF